jgi:hypothetical protein
MNKNLSMAILAAVSCRGAPSLKRIVTSSNLRIVGVAGIEKLTLALDSSRNDGARAILMER